MGTRIYRVRWKEQGGEESRAVELEKGRGISVAVRRSYIEDALPGAE